MKKGALALFILFFIFLRVNAQSSSDCIGAIPFCSGPGDGVASVSSGDGNIHNETALSCVDNEGFSTWYTFTATTDGFFRFTLTPVNIEDDYDWALFNTTGYSCSSIPINSSLLVSCNSYGDFGTNGPTGISTSLGGSGNQNGPGDMNGPPFNADLQIYAGQTYKLMVSNWSESPAGFNINVSASTADGIYNNIGISNFNNQEICLGDGVLLNVNVPGSNNLFYWSPENMFVNPYTQNPSFKQKLTTDTEIEINVTSGLCTYSQSSTIYVGSITYDKNNINFDACIGDEINLGISFTGMELPSGLKYTWSPDSSLSEINTANPLTSALLNTTQFYFEIINGPCRSYDSLTVFVHKDTVHADFDYFKNDNDLTIPVEADFSNLSIGDSTSFWFFGDSTTSIERSPFQHEYPGYDSYRVELIVKSPSTFCVDTAIKILNYPFVIYPNIITPNGDDKNDALWITGLKIGTAIKIYSRWGRLVYESDNYQHDWDGQDLSDGTYYLLFIDDNNETKKGWIQVSR